MRTRGPPPSAASSPISADLPGRPPEARQGDPDQAADCRFGRHRGGCGQRVQAVGRELRRRYVAARFPAGGGLADQRGDELVQVRVRAGDVLAPVQRRRQLAAMPAPPARLGDVGPQDRLEPLGRRRRRADRGELLAGARRSAVRARQSGSTRRQGSTCTRWPGRCRSALRSRTSSGRSARARRPAPPWHRGSRRELRRGARRSSRSRSSASLDRTLCRGHISLT